MAARDERGRFIKGQSGNPAGRASRQVEAEYLNTTIAAVSLGDWKQIVDKAVQQAKTGDGDARKWLAEYILGKPVQRTELSGDGGIMQIVVNEVPARSQEAPTDA